MISFWLKGNGSFQHFYTHVWSKVVCSFITITYLYLRPLISSRRKKQSACYRSLALGSVKATQEKFESTALFLRLGVPSTLVRHENGAFQKRYLNGFSISCRKHFKNGAFPQRHQYSQSSRDFPARFFLKRESKMTSDCCFSNVSNVVWTEKHFMRFHSETLIRFQIPPANCGYWGFTLTTY